MSLHPGLSAIVEYRVTETDTAASVGSGDVEVLATPTVITLMERAACDAVRGELTPGTTTVGFRVQVDHMAPTGVGTDVRAEATLERTEGRRLVFSVSVRDACGLIAAGKVTRVVVAVDRFLERIR